MLENGSLPAGAYQGRSRFAWADRLSLLDPSLTAADIPKIQEVLPRRRYKDLARVR